MRVELYNKMRAVLTLRLQAFQGRCRDHIRIRVPSSPLGERVRSVAAVNQLQDSFVSMLNRVSGDEG
jgi:hypothetical protein